MVWCSVVWCGWKSWVGVPAVRAAIGMGMLLSWLYINNWLTQNPNHKLYDGVCYSPER